MLLEVASYTPSYSLKHMLNNRLTLRHADHSTTPIPPARHLVCDIDGMHYIVAYIMLKYMWCFATQHVYMCSACCSTLFGHLRLE